MLYVIFHCYCSVAKSCPTLCDLMDCSTPGFTVLHLSLLKFMSIELVMPCSHLVLCCPLLLLSSMFPSIRVFYNKSVLHIRWPKNWSFSFSISPSNEYSGLISFRIGCFDVLAVQGTSKSLLQQHSSKALILLCSASFMVQLSHPSDQFSSVAQSCLCNPMDCSIPGFPVHHQPPDLTQIHVHRVDNAIQPFHPLLAPSPLAFNLSQHQGLFPW